MYVFVNNEFKVFKIVFTWRSIYEFYQWCCGAPRVPNGLGVRPDTQPNASGKRWGNYLFITVQKLFMLINLCGEGCLKLSHSSVLHQPEVVLVRNGIGGF